MITDDDDWSCVHACEENHPGMEQLNMLLVGMDTNRRWPSEGRSPRTTFQPVLGGRMRCADDLNDQDTSAVFTHNRQSSYLKIAVYSAPP